MRILPTKMSRRVWLCIAAAIGILLLCVSVSLRYAPFIIGGFDEPLKDDSDIRALAVFPAAGSGESAYQLACKEMLALQEAGVINSPKIEELEGLAPNEILQIFSENPVQQLLVESSQSEKEQWITWVSHIDALPILPGISRHWEARCLAVEALAGEGYPEHAFELWSETEMFVENIGYSTFNMVGVFVFFALADRELSALGVLVDQSSESEILEKISLTLQSREDLSERVVRTGFAGQYIQDLALLDQAIVETNLDLKRDHKFQTNKTKNLIFDRNSQVIVAFEEPILGTFDDGFFEQREQERGTISGELRAWFKGNTVGKMLNSIMTPVLGRIDVQYGGLIEKIRLLQIKIALLKYENEMSNIPGSLDDLAPRWIGELPKSPFEGSVINYRPDDRLLEGKEVTLDF